jgi:hypothetical protein
MDAFPDSVASRLPHLTSQGEPSKPSVYLRKPIAIRTTLAGVSIRFDALVVLKPLKRLYDRPVYVLTQALPNTPLDGVAIWCTGLKLSDKFYDNVVDDLVDLGVAYLHSAPPVLRGDHSTDARALLRTRRAAELGWAKRPPGLVRG